MLKSYSSILAAPLVLGLVCMSGCVRRETPAEIAIRDRALLLGNLSEPKDLDPHTVTGVTEFNVISALLEGLVAEDPRDLHPVPAVAASWAVSSDGLCYTFHLRPEARWSNGDPVTAQDFVFSFQRMLSPRLASAYAYMLYPLTNAEAYHKGQIEDFRLVGARAQDARTLELTLHHPVPYFLSLLTHHAWYPVHPPTILRHGPADLPASGWTQPGRFVGNGPFVLSTWEPNRKIVVSASPTYWDAARVFFRRIEFYPIGDARAEEMAFRAGQLHVTGTVPLDRIDFYRTRQPELLRLDPYLGTYYYLFNVRRAPLQDRRVRRALALAVDREAIVRRITRAGEEPAWHFTPPGTAGYTSRSRLKGTPETARQLLAEAGYPGGRGFPVLEVLYNTSEAHARIAQAVQQMWMKELGIRVELVNMEWKVYLARTQEGQFDIARAGWIGDYLDPNTFLDLWVSDGGNNRTGWSHPEYDRRIREAATTSDPQARMELFQQAEEILMEEVPILPLYFYRSKSLVHPRVIGRFPNLLDRHPYKHMAFSPK